MIAMGEEQKEHAQIDDYPTERTMKEESKGCRCHCCSFFCHTIAAAPPRSHSQVVVACRCWGW